MRRLRVVAGVGLLLLSGCGGEETPVPEPTPAPTTSAIPPFSEPGDSGRLEVVESGLSVLHTEDGAVDIGFGYLLENTSTLVATDTKVRVELLDESGTVVWTTDRWSEPIRMLPPGQRFGSGHVIGPLGSQRVRDNPPADIRVVVGGSLWYPPESALVDFPQVTVTDGSIDDYCVDAAQKLTVDSGYPGELAAALHTVIRDRDGAIVAGSGSGLLGPEVTLTPGSSSHERTLVSIFGCPTPPGGDPDSFTTEHFVNPLSAVEDPAEPSADPERAEREAGSPAPSAGEADSEEED